MPKWATAGNAINLDFGRDYMSLAGENFNAGEYGVAALMVVDAISEATYDLGVAYAGASLIGLFAGGAASTSATVASSTVAISQTPLVQRMVGSLSSIAPNASNWTIKSYHLMNGTGDYSKFATNSVSQVQSWTQKALSSGNAIIKPNGSSIDSVQIFVNMGEVVGTRGEKIIKIVVTESGKIITAFPVNGIPE
jgi:hypothetical protein